MAFATGPDGAGRATGIAAARGRQISGSNAASARTVTNRSGNSTSTWTISATSKQVIASSANSTTPVVYGELKDLAKLTNAMPGTPTSPHRPNTADIVMSWVR